MPLDLDPHCSLCLKVIERGGIHNAETGRRLCWECMTTCVAYLINVAKEGVEALESYARSFRCMWCAFSERYDSSEACHEAMRKHALVCPQHPRALGF